MNRNTVRIRAGVGCLRKDYFTYPIPAPLVTAPYPILSYLILLYLSEREEKFHPRLLRDRTGEIGYGGEQIRTAESVHTVHTLRFFL